MVFGAVMFGRGRNQCGVLIEPQPAYAVDPADEAALVKFRNDIWCVSMFLSIFPPTPFLPCRPHVEHTLLPKLSPLCFHFCFLLFLCLISEPDMMLNSERQAGGRRSQSHCSDIRPDLQGDDFGHRPAATASTRR